MQVARRVKEAFRMSKLPILCAKVTVLHASGVTSSFVMQFQLGRGWQYFYCLLLPGPVVMTTSLIRAGDN
eukprot:scaffold214568_cov15-Tisochrysis_lutea.AAC.1